MTMSNLIQITNQDEAIKLLNLEGFTQWINTAESDQVNLDIVSSMLIENFANANPDIINSLSLAAQFWEDDSKVGHIACILYEHREADTVIEYPDSIEVKSQESGTDNNFYTFGSRVLIYHRTDSGNSSGNYINIEGVNDSDHMAMGIKVTIAYDYMDVIPTSLSSLFE